MTNKEEWVVTKYWHGLPITVGTRKTHSINLGLKVLGAAAMAGIGALCGEAMEHLPYVAEYVPRIMETALGIGAENLSGAGALVGAAFGYGKSGLYIGKDSREPYIATLPVLEWQPFPPKLTLETLRSQRENRSHEISAD